MHLNSIEFHVSSFILLTLFFYVQSHNLSQE